MIIMYVYYTNKRLVETIKNISDIEMLCAYDVLYDTSETVGHAQT